MVKLSEPLNKGISGTDVLSKRIHGSTLVRSVTEEKLDGKTLSVQWEECDLLIACV